MKIMIADDSPDMRALIRVLLRDSANEVVECSDGQEAVTMFAIERPDWAVLDIVMRPMDGLTAARRIVSQFPDAQIIVITQHNSPKLRDLALQAGAKGFLFKEDLLQLPALLAASGRADRAGKMSVDEAPPEQGPETPPSAGTSTN